MELEVPQDRDGAFQPKIVPKRACRLAGVDEMVVSLVAKGLTTGEVQAHLAEVYGAGVSRETISKITDAVHGADGGVAVPAPGPGLVYPVLFIDALFVKVRDGQVANRPIYVAIGVNVDGEGDILGLWAGRAVRARSSEHRCSPRPRPVSCTCCATASGTRRRSTGRPSPVT
ncbi:MAG: transposase [Acidimicrobiales bacterium]